MGNLTRNAIAASSGDALFTLLGEELQRRISAGRGEPEFVAEIRTLPVGLGAMAATYELDVSLTLDDLGWHFGNWHDAALAEETARGLEELEAVELAAIFRQAFRLAEAYWSELGTDGWSDWYNRSALRSAMDPLNDRAWALLRGKKDGISQYWVDYARKYPERVGAADD
jgi:hypothetical protein